MNLVLDELPTIRGIGTTCDCLTVTGRRCRNRAVVTFGCDWLSSRVNVCHVHRSMHLSATRCNKA